MRPGPCRLPSIPRRYSTYRPHRPPSPTTTTNRTPPPGYRLPGPKPSNTPPIPPANLISDTLPLSPFLEFPTRYIPYSKRNPKFRPIPGEKQTSHSALSENLKLNPYALILASPIRNAAPHHIRLPSFLLVKLGLIRNPNLEADSDSEVTTTTTIQSQNKSLQKEPKRDVCLLPSNLSPKTHNRQITMQGVHTSCSRKAFDSLFKKNAWRKMIPHEGSRGSGDVRWRGDMTLYVEKLLKERVFWELEKMLLQGKAVMEVVEEDDALDDDVGCILLWDNAKKPTPESPTQQPHHTSKNLQSHQHLPPIYDMYTLFPPSQNPNQTQIIADDIKSLLGVNKNAKRAVIKIHEATVKAQMWLLKLKYFGY